VCGCVKVGETGKVVGIEHIEDLVKWSADNVRRIPQLAERLSDGRIKIVAGDGRKGYSSEAPYDAIHVGAAAPELPPAVVVTYLLMHITVKCSKFEFLFVPCLRESQSATDFNFHI